VYSFEFLQSLLGYFFDQPYLGRACLAYITRRGTDYKIETVAWEVLAV